jgi:hypothetical protein
MKNLPLAFVRTKSQISLSHHPIGPFASKRQLCLEQDNKEELILYECTCFILIHYQMYPTGEDEEEFTAAACRHVKSLSQEGGNRFLAFWRNRN